MKKALLATAIAALTMSNVWAADGSTTELRVTGKLLVGGCTATVNGGNALDFGSHLISDLSSTAVNDIATERHRSGHRVPQRHKSRLDADR
ncbi:Protein of uncharacterised function (DUF1120) [Citrobacter koseri]|uniref:Protein of uncharacterized function (DUF1120) n=1 Tax=Citrobacter koseri TaxID=545 RepID=A0A2X2VAR4_CITKO|nr:Protein of uncharacterised function (DUF1120) [Citrobacter koseri]